MKLAIIGIGNRSRGDDGAGIRAVRKLRKANLPGVAVLESSGEDTALMEAWEGFDTVILIDAMSSGVRTGTVRRFDAGVDALPSDQFSPHSTHALGVAAVVELARILDRLPPSLVVFGIEGKSFNYGCGLSPEVDAGVAEAVQLIMTEVKSCAADAR